MFPITKQYLQKFRTDGDPYYATIQHVIGTSLPEIVTQAQSYIDAYEQGVRVNYSTDIAGIYMAIHGIVVESEVAATTEPTEEQEYK